MTQMEFTERRVHPRVEMGLSVVLILGRRVFRTVSANISLGGLQLKVPLPEEYRHPNLTVVLKMPGGNRSVISFVSFVNNSDLSRLQFVDLCEGDKKELQEWIRQFHPKNV